MANNFDGQMLRRIRKEAGYTQDELARRIGLSRETISAIENEHKKSISGLRIETIKLWMKACGSRVSADTKKSFSDYIRFFLKVS